MLVLEHELEVRTSSKRNATSVRDRKEAFNRMANTERKIERLKSRWEKQNGNT
jgi:hypothetical protein